ncbi:MAG: hypothetical protein MJ252_04220 [archaeon]|nr:hypothetical protein [archaeon]
MDSEESLLKEALINFAYENYETAEVEFKKLTELKPNESSYKLYLGNCELKLKKWEAAYNLFEEALKLSSEPSFNILFSKGIACFYLSKYVESKLSFTDALKLTKDPKQQAALIPWTNRVEIELNEAGVVEYNSSSDKDLKLISNWIQNNTTITVELTTNQNLSNFDIKFDKKQITIQNKSDEKIKHVMNLTNAIIPEKCTVKINGMKAELILVKEVPDFDWVNLEINKRENPSQTASGYSNISSSKVKKNWDKFEKEFDEEYKAEHKCNGGNEGMMNLFRQIYESGDENCRRAMIKSFQTSGGTVLSTNWDDVKNKEYDGKDRPEAPKGQEWAKFDS